jgi:hypothetical protein
MEASFTSHTPTGCMYYRQLSTVGCLLSLHSLLHFLLFFRFLHSCTRKIDFADTLEKEVEWKEWKRQKKGGVSRRMWGFSLAMLKQNGIEDTRVRDEANVLRFCFSRSARVRTAERLPETSVTRTQNVWRHGSLSCFLCGGILDRCKHRSDITIKQLISSYLIKPI